LQAIICSRSRKASERDRERLSQKAAHRMSLNPSRVHWYFSIVVINLFLLVTYASLATGQSNVVIPTGNVGSTQNQAPALAPIGPRSVSENQLLSFSLSATDADGDSLVYNATSLPEGAVLQGDTFRWTPQEDQEGSHLITFSVSDGQAYDSENVTLTVYIHDSDAPSISLTQPADTAIQVPINTVIALNIEDTGVGVDAATVRITVNDHVVYTGSTESYASTLGHCYRSGTRAAYRYMYQPTDPFSYDQQVTVTAQASDRSGNSVPLQRFSFTTAMRSFGKNVPVSGPEVSAGAGSAAIDSRGRIWTAWHQGEAGQRQVMLSQWDPDQETVEWVTPFAVQGPDRCHPTLAIDEHDRMTLAWQERHDGQWDVYVSQSITGRNWSAARRVSDLVGNQTAPVLAVGSEEKVYLAWIDDQHGNNDIFLCTTDTGFASQTKTRITQQTANQRDPALAVDPHGQLYLCWTDDRDGHADIYGTHSGLGWAHVLLVNHPGEQAAAALAVSPRDGSVHCVWTDDQQGHRDVYYGHMEEMSTRGLSRILVNDDGGAADQSAPVLALGQNPQGGENIYISWIDDRYRQASEDTDLFYAEVRAGSVSTNVLVGDDGTNSHQSQPDLLVDAHGQPVLLWSDNRGELGRIYGAGVTHIRTTALFQGRVSAAVGGRLGTDPERIGEENDLSMDLPPGAYGYDLTYTVAEIQNTPHFDGDCVSGYEIGPSGLQFHHPVTVTVPYQRDAVKGPPIPYWFDEQTGGLCQTGISDVVYWHVSDELGVLQFKTTHLTSYYVLDGETHGASIGASGGGCALMPTSGGMSDLYVPALVVAIVLAWMARRDRQQRHFIRP